MTTKKLASELAHEVIESLPPDCTLEDIVSELQIMRIVERGLLDIEAGRTFTTDEVKAKMQSWQF